MLRRKIGKSKSDYLGLIDGYPNDDLSVLHTELLMNVTTDYEVLPFLDGYYNQIKSHPEAEEMVEFGH